MNTTYQGFLDNLRDAERKVTLCEEAMFIARCFSKAKEYFTWEYKGRTERLFRDELFWGNNIIALSSSDVQYYIDTYDHYNNVGEQENIPPHLGMLYRLKDALDFISDEVTPHERLIVRMVIDETLAKEGVAA